MSRRRWGDPLARDLGRRQARINDLLRREIGNILQRTYADRLGSLVTVTEVRTTGDLRHARIFVAILADRTQQDQSLQILQNHRSEVRQSLADRIILKHVPSLTFMLDDSAERVRRIEELLGGEGSSEG